jgi:hypothetical protein
MKRLLSFAILTLTLLAGEFLPAGPLTLTWGAQNAGGAVGTAKGADLPAGSLARLGTFNLAAAQIQALAWNPPALQEHFREISRARIGQFGSSTHNEVSGAFAQTVSFDSDTLDESVLGEPLCVWITRGPDDAAPEETGIFSHPQWMLHRGAFGVLVWDLSQITPLDVIVGACGPETSATLTGLLHKLASVAALADQADSDHDGAVNLLEEAFGMNPQSADTHLLPQPDTGAGPSRLQFRRPAGGVRVNAAVYETSQFRYTVEVSTDLTSWASDPAVCQDAEAMALGGGMELATIVFAAPALGLSPQPQRFARIRVDRLP